MSNGHRGTATTLQVLRGYCVWHDIENNMVKFVKKCLHCQVSKTGKMVLRPLGKVVYIESIGEGAYFDFLHVDVSRPLDTKGVGKQGYQCLMVIVDAFSSSVWMEEAATCTTKVAARMLLRWCSLIGVPRVCESDTARYFKNHAFRLVVEHLGAKYCFSVANTTWITGTVARKMLEIMTMFKAMASAARFLL